MAALEWMIPLYEEKAKKTQGCRQAATKVSLTSMRHPSVDGLALVAGRLLNAIYNAREDDL
jgi:hypothetical protein